MFMTALLQLFDRSGVLYGELARFILRLLGIRTKPREVNSPVNKNCIEEPKAASSGSWDNVWENDTTKCLDCRAFLFLDSNYVQCDVYLCSAWLGSVRFLISLATKIFMIMKQFGRRKKTSIDSDGRVFEYLFSGVEVDLFRLLETLHFIGWLSSGRLQYIDTNNVYLDGHPSLTNTPRYVSSGVA
ncbi:hypothetical protein L6164_019290 [Bauhinia variegata]|uniref:Uncharacterized protein n=1 Tax=Bauhinia variegata TaxID=167791 RepID=A0ACB9NIT8_BAUVA|nr:hypothetical protein L6164_019290 [Bauhinia variegata]